MYQGDTQKVPLAGYTKDTLEKKIQSDHDTLNNLLNRRMIIKRALILANVAVTIDVKGQTYTIVEALELKNLVAAKKTIVREMKNQLNTVQQRMDKNESELTQAISNVSQNVVSEIQKPEKYPIKCQFYFKNKWVEEMLISEYILILVPEYLE